MLPLETGEVISNCHLVQLLFFFSIPNPLVMDLIGGFCFCLPKPQTYS